MSSEPFEYLTWHASNECMVLRKETYSDSPEAPCPNCARELADLGPRNRDGSYEVGCECGAVLRLEQQTTITYTLRYEEKADSPTRGAERLDPSKIVLPVLFFVLRHYLTLCLLLLGLLLSQPVDAGNYHRPAWRDDDHDCQSTRTEVLIRTCAAVKLSPSGCKVVQATCLDLYSGAEVSSDTPAQTFHVDHIFPAAIAYQRRSWSPGAFAGFFNDQRNLLVTRARTNLRKSDRMPHEWCPAERGARFLVAKRFREVARIYGLPILPVEEVGLRAWEAGACAPGAVTL